MAFRDFSSPRAFGSVGILPNWKRHPPRDLPLQTRRQNQAVSSFKIGDGADTTPLPSVRSCFMFLSTLIFHQLWPTPLHRLRSFGTAQESSRESPFVASLRGSGMRGRFP